jgi:GNAT superfamily N-acetyltransferase
MSIQIRPAKASDMEACAALRKEIYNTTYQGVVDSRLITSVNQEDSLQRLRSQWLEPGGMFFILEEIAEEPVAGAAEDAGAAKEAAVEANDGEPNAEPGSEPAEAVTFLGYVRGLPSPDVLGAFWLESLYLTEAARGKGLGRKLIFYMGDQVRRQGYNQMVIDVFAGNDRAEEIYRHLGAKLINDNFTEDINLFLVHAKLLLWDNLSIFAEN